MSDGERAALIGGVLSLLVGLAVMWKWDIWWTTLPSFAVMAATMVVRSVRCWRVGDRENAFMAAGSVALAVLALGAVVTDWTALWVAVAALAFVGAAELLRQLRRDRREFREWQRRWAVTIEEGRPHG